MYYSSLRPTAATVGTFDGVHRGHRIVLDELLAVARQKGEQPLVFTFSSHPLALIAPARAPLRLMDPADEVAELEKIGAEVVTLDFDERLRSLSARQWLASLASDYGVRTLIMGYDNTFGCDGVQLTLDGYHEAGREAGIEICVAPRLDGISSSAIRRFVAAGEITKANEALGYPYSLSGQVVSGQQLGRELGFPTANLKPSEGRLVPGSGVYAANAVLPDGQTLPAVVNIGHRPTVADDGHLTIEAHLLGWDGDLYRRPLTLRFQRRLRDERHFDSLDQLREAIAADINNVRRAIPAPATAIN